MEGVRCKGCNRSFKSSDTLQRHLRGPKNVRCHDAYYRSQAPAPAGLLTNGGELLTNSGANHNKKQKTVQDDQGEANNGKGTSHSLQASNTSDTATEECIIGNSDDEPIVNYDEEPMITHDEEREETDDQPTMPLPNDPAADVGHMPIDSSKGLSSGLDAFRDYLTYANQHYGALEDNYKAAVELMSLMNTKGGSIALYDAIISWHIRHLKGNQHDKISSNRLHSTLMDRYNMNSVLPYEVQVTLQATEGSVPVLCHDCEAQTIDLLSDPRWLPSDLLVPGTKEEPWVLPKDIEYLADIDTGRAYRETHKKLIDPMPYTRCGRRRVLCPYIFYLDGCVTGQTQNQEVEILKFTIGLLNQRARRQQWAWRELGIIHHEVKGKGQAKNIVNQSNNIDAENYIKLDNYYRTQIAQQFEEDIDGLEHFGLPIGDTDPELSVKNAQDLHTQLKVIMNSYKKVEEAGGINWDLRTNDGLQHLRLVPFIIFFKVDGKEGDKLCLQYTNKNKDVGCLCNVCCCPTQHSHDAYRDDTAKSVPMIKELVQQSKGKELKEMSQHLANNALHEFTFGLHNDRGIHGATHLEALHSIQLGQYGYSRNTFFSQTGKDSQLSVKINNIATAMGIYLERHSDKTLPRTSYNRGIQSGKVAGHEMTGLILVLTLTLRTTLGRNTILEEARGNQKVYFPDESAVQQWINLLEAQLQYEAWTKSAKMKLSLVERSDKKIREYMNMCKLVQKRDILGIGMGHNTKNHHGQKHLCESILDFGVPKNINTFDNERHHKPDKLTAQRTQKIAEKFDSQMGRKIQERRAVALGAVELDHVRKWHYRRPKCTGAEGYETDFEPKFTGVSWTLSKVKGTDNIKVFNTARNKGKVKTRMDEHTKVVVAELLEFCSDYISSVEVYEEWTVGAEEGNDEKNTQVYRATPYNEGKPWYDWATFDLSDGTSNWKKRVACQIKGFVNLLNLPEEAEEDIGFAPGAYAVVETTVPSPDPKEHYRSELWSPVLKLESKSSKHAATNNHTEIVSLDKLLEPIIVVPDHGNENKRAFLELLRRKHWATLFEDWLELPDKRAFERNEEDVAKMKEQLTKAKEKLPNRKS